MKIAHVIAAAVLLAAGCSSSGGGGGASCDAHCSSTTFRGVTDGPVDSLYPNDHLTAFGATRTKWAANHTANPDPNLDEGCCYGPPVVSPDNGGTADTWNLAGSSGDVVDELMHNFPPGTSEADAIGAVEQQDLPPDAHLINANIQATCDTRIYRSDTLGRSTSESDVGDFISVTLYGPIDEATGDSIAYDPSNVVQVIESLGNDPSTAC